VRPRVAHTRLSDRIAVQGNAGERLAFGESRQKANGASYHEDFEAVGMAFAGLTVLVVDCYLAVLGA